jgi:glycosyltransferase involved in cell wall biosynthesis
MKTLLIFNLETNLDSTVLAGAHDWIIEFSKHYEELIVISNRVGRYQLPLNVTVLEMSLSRNKLKFIRDYLRTVMLIIRRRSQLHIFYHMTSYSLMIFAPFAHILKVRQSIWYSHSVADFPLRASLRYADFAVSSSKGSFPLVIGPKLHEIGHGISINANDMADYHSVQIRKGTVIVGRVTPIKRIEAFIEALGQDPIIAQRYLPVHIYGPITDKLYKDFLLGLADQHGIKIFFFGELPYKEIQENNKKYRFVFSGTPKSTDKALLEACISGCIPLTENLEAQALVGADLMWQEMQLKNSENLPAQLSKLALLSDPELKNFGILIARRTKENNNLENTVQRIADLFQTKE